MSPTDKNKGLINVFGFKITQFRNPEFKTIEYSKIDTNCYYILYTISLFWCELQLIFSTICDGTN